MSKNSIQDIKKNLEILKKAFNKKKELDLPKGVKIKFAATGLSYTLKNGDKIVTKDDSLKIGGQVYTIDNSGNQTNLNDGDYELSNGTCLTIKDGAIEGINREINPQAEEAGTSDEPVEVKQNSQKMTKQQKELEARRNKFSKLLAKFEEQMDDEGDDDNSEENAEGNAVKKDEKPDASKPKGMAKDITEGVERDKKSSEVREEGEGFDDVEGGKEDEKDQTEGVERKAKSSEVREEGEGFDDSEDGSDDIGSRLEALEDAIEEIISHLGNQTSEMKSMKKEFKQWGDAPKGSNFSVPMEKKFKMFGANETPTTYSKPLAASKMNKIDQSFAKIKTNSNPNWKGFSIEMQGNKIVNKKSK